MACNGAHVAAISFTCAVDHRHQVPHHFGISFDGVPTRTDETNDTFQEIRGPDDSSTRVCLCSRCEMRVAFGNPFFMQLHSFDVEIKKILESNVCFLGMFRCNLRRRSKFYFFPAVRSQRYEEAKMDVIPGLLQGDQVFVLNNASPASSGDLLPGETLAGPKRDVKPQLNGRQSQQSFRYLHRIQHLREFAGCSAVVACLRVSSSRGALQHRGR
mmetsp:Transcript_11642/g.28696  ORF Transcript_11642/g.28696 Transcript_11642/m.28696 type:complete len:214 (+) Transcript_11642:756-1397(+)